MGESTREKIKYYGTILGVLAASSAVAVYAVKCEGDSHVAQIKTSLPNEASRIIDRIKVEGKYTDQDVQDFITALKTFSKEHNTEWRKTVTEINKTEIDGAPIMSRYGVKTGYIPGIIDKFIHDVAEALAKDKESSMLFSPESFQGRVTMNDAIIKRRR